MTTAQQNLKAAAEQALDNVANDLDGLKIETNGAGEIESAKRRTPTKQEQVEALAYQYRLEIVESPSDARGHYYKLIDETTARDVVSFLNKVGQLNLEYRVLIQNLYVAF